LKSIFVRLFFTFQGAVIIALPGQSLAVEVPVGKIIGITGTIECLNEGSKSVSGAHSDAGQRVSYKFWKKVEFYQVVYANDRFRTANDSHLEILLSDNSHLFLRPNSEVKVGSYLKDDEDTFRQWLIKMVHGFSTYLTHKSPNSKDPSFKIVSPTANIAARGVQRYESSKMGEIVVTLLLCLVLRLPLGFLVFGMLII
jgi:hypothetical protein